MPSVQNYYFAPKCWLNVSCKMGCLHRQCQIRSEKEKSIIGTNGWVNQNANKNRERECVRIGGFIVE